MHYRVKTLPFLLVSLCSVSYANATEITIYQLTSQGVGAPIGTISAKATATGTEFVPNLEQLSPGVHGFHIHQKPSCDSAEKQGKTIPGLAAKGHFDPSETGYHSGPKGDGHLGDLPPLTVDNAGKATTPVVAPRVKLSDLKGRALIIHAGGDNFSDQPKKLGGGGARVACGIVD